MAKTKMDSLVRYNNEVTTIAELDEKGLIEFSSCQMSTRKRNGERGIKTVYFADIKGTESGWEINKTAYMSRTGKKDKIKF